MDQELASLLDGCGVLAGIECGFCTRWMWRVCLSFRGKNLNKKNAIFIFSQSFYT
jgi:hypothetical protein